MSDTWWGFNTDFGANLLRFSWPTHTHNFDNYKNGYGRSKTALVRSLADCRKSASSKVLNFKTDSESTKITIFKIFILHNQLVNLMICTHDLTVHTKQKKMTHYCGSHVFGDNTRF
jgi:hypothetical protein